MYQHEENLTMSRAFARSVERHGDRVAQRFNPDLYYGDNGVSSPERDATACGGHSLWPAEPGA